MLDKSNGVILIAGVILFPIFFITTAINIINSSDIVDLTITGSPIPPLNIMITLLASAIMITSLYAFLIMFRMVDEKE